jgi:hypothetical protein
MRARAKGWEGGAPDAVAGGFTWNSGSRGGRRPVSGDGGKFRCANGTWILGYVWAQFSNGVLPVMYRNRQAYELGQVESDEDRLHSKPAVGLVKVSACWCFHKKIPPCIVHFSRLVTGARSRDSGSEAWPPSARSSILQGKCSIQENSLHSKGGLPSNSSSPSRP